MNLFQKILKRRTSYLTVFSGLTWHITDSQQLVCFVLLETHLFKKHLHNVYTKLFLRVTHLAQSCGYLAGRTAGQGAASSLNLGSLRTRRRGKELGDWGGGPFWFSQTTYHSLLIFTLEFFSIYFLCQAHIHKRAFKNLENMNSVTITWTKWRGKPRSKVKIQQNNSPKLETT